MTIAINEATGEMGTIFVEEPGFVDYYTTADEWVRAASTTPISDTGTITVDGKTYTVWLTGAGNGENPLRICELCAENHEKSFKIMRESKKFISQSAEM